MDVNTTDALQQSKNNKKIEISNYH
jgi:hypothetical protein